MTKLLARHYHERLRMLYASCWLSIAYITC
jgi:hypothetical protein